MTNITLAPVRPPYVRFERRPVEDRDASIAAGGMVYKDVDFAIVMQPGSKDTHEPVATEWLAEIRRQASLTPPLYPPHWVDHFERQYKAWKEGQELPVNGLSVRQWPACSPAMAETFVSLRVMCVEDVAAMNEETMRKIPNGREWKRKAQVFLEAREGNKQAEVIAALHAQIANKDARIASLEERIAMLEQRLPAGPAGAQPVPEMAAEDFDLPEDEHEPAPRRAGRRR